MHAMPLAIRQEPHHIRAGIVLAVLLLHGGLASWLTGVQQLQPAQALSSRIVVRLHSAMPTMPQTVARPLPAIKRQSSHLASHLASHLPSPAPKAKPAVPQVVSARPLATEHSAAAAPAVLSGTATNTSISASAQAATAPTAPADAHQAASSEAGFSADYLHNPAPVYPPSARRNGEEGRVLLRVLVSATGQADRVDIQHGSGFPRLDEAAREAVANWRFTPARRGAQAIASTVIVPITFRLGH